MSPAKQAAWYDLGGVKGRAGTLASPTPLLRFVESVVRKVIVGYDSVRSQLDALDRETQGREMRKLGAAPDCIVGSAHAVTDDGQILIGSGSGRQLGAYAGGNVVLVIGHQKLVRDLDEAPVVSASTACPASTPVCKASATPAVSSPRL